MAATTFLPFKDFGKTSKNFLLISSCLFLIFFGFVSKTIAAESGFLSLAWNPVNDSRVAFYEVHYGTTSKTYRSQVAATQTQTTVYGLNPGVRYFIAVRACTTNATICSGFSNEVSSIVTKTSELTPTITSPSGTRNLTNEGPADWVHWGLFAANSINRKASVQGQIGNLQIIGGTATRYGGDGSSRLRQSWSDGTPTRTASTRSGVYIGGLSKGFELVLPADASTKTVFLYLGGYKTHGRITARMSDGSIPSFNKVVGNLNGAFDRRVALKYRAASAGQRLIVTYTQIRSGGNVTFQAAALQQNASSALALGEARDLSPQSSMANFAFAEEGLDTGDVAFDEVEDGADGLDLNKNPSIQIGEIDVNQEWQYVTFDRPFDDPIVVLKSLSSHDPKPATIRVNGVDSEGFWVRVQGWHSDEDWHELETIPFIVMERGRYQLPDRGWIEADSLVSVEAGVFHRHEFMSSFATSPVVLTATTSFDEEDAVMSRIRNVNATGFDHGLFEQARDHQEHAPESIDYIAWEPSSGVLDGLRFEVGRKSGFGHGFMNLVFESLFQRPPVFIPELQTTYGQTTDILRWKNLHAESVDIRVQGEADRQGSDPEDGSEDDLGYIAIDID